jgi:hypothetical protein
MHAGFSVATVFISIGPAAIPSLQKATLDSRALLFTLVVSLSSGILVGTAPAAVRPSLEALAVATQLAVSLVLLAGAGLLERSLWNLETEGR